MGKAGEGGRLHSMSDARLQNMDSLKDDIKWSVYDSNAR